MPRYLISGSKTMKDGQVHIIAEEARSETKAEWIRAKYVAEGYKTEIKMEEQRNA